MGFFGRIGIDGGLLLAQAVNFGVLVWFLNRFVYKPLLKGMESSELERAEREMGEIRKEREAFAKERAAQLVKDKKRTAGMISDAEKVVNDLSERIKSEAQEEKERMLALFRERVAAQEVSLAVSLPLAVKKTIVERLAATWRARLDDDEVARLLQLRYLDDLTRSISGLKTDRLEANDDDFILVGALTAGEKEVGAVAAAIEKKIKRSGITVRTEADSALLAGYRLEVSGVAIDRNLRADINHAVQGS